jgi:hypothetical protein
MKNGRNARKNRQKPWKESRVNLVAASALVLDGPGSDWLLVVRGERPQATGRGRRSTKGGRS